MRPIRAGRPRNRRPVPLWYPPMTDDMAFEALDGARRWLDWYRAMGVDAALGEEPIDWLARGPSAPGADYVLPGRATAQPPAASRPPSDLAAGVSGLQRPPEGPRPSEVPRPGPTPLRPMPAPGRPATPAPARTFPAVPPDAATQAARTAAATCASLAELSAALARFDGCGLKTTAKNTCFYRGAEMARLVIVGEAPGSDEDRTGQPFVGRAGQLLDLMLKAIGLGPDDVHITNIVYWRPPGNRTPTPQEAQACRPFLDRQIALVRPDLVLALGGAAAKHILGVEDGIMRVRGKWRDIAIGGHAVRAMATLHPAYLLRTPAAKRLAWRDLLQVRAALLGS